MTVHVLYIDIVYMMYSQSLTLLWKNELKINLPGSYDSSTTEETHVIQNVDTKTTNHAMANDNYGKKMPRM